MNQPDTRKTVAKATARTSRPRLGVALAVALALGPFALATAPANAEGPAGECPPTYTLVAITSIPSPGQPGAYALDQRGNNDGYVCLMAYPNPDHPGAPYNGIDNKVPVG